ncbi:MAG: hypothetical protein IJZ83_03985 [Clostridia bacterium]|nr:hypothetical protein [Clostridia bacterium]
MNTVKIDFLNTVGAIKPMNAVNNGPKSKAAVQTRGNFQYYKDARFPYARTHDSDDSTAYGGPHVVDIFRVFPDFDADPNLPESYDFYLTDRYLQNIMDAGAKVFYRLGQTIEHAPKKYYIHPPKDFKKWAVICEHIIRHYNEGWADGFYHGIEYWEIWNEPDLQQDNNSPTWSGTKEQFFDLYEITANHLKSLFPNLKIGGPAAVGSRGYMAEFINEMKNRSVPLDFFSWHKYDCKIENVMDRVFFVRKCLDDAGYEKTESILNEWAYIKGWGSHFVYSLEAINGIKGASYVGGVMATCQYAPLDMLMYYDLSPGAIFNGVFEHLSQTPLQTYYSFYWFANLADLGNAVKIESCENIYCVAATDGKRHGILLTHYNDDDATDPKKIELSWNGLKGKTKITVYRTDANNYAEPITEMIVDGAQTAEWHGTLKLYDVCYVDIIPID